LPDLSTTIALQESVLFEASTGFFLRGHVAPPVSGVKIDLVDRTAGISRQTVYTNEQGAYKVSQTEPILQLMCTKAGEFYLEIVFLFSKVCAPTLFLIFSANLRL
jgi:hypothetical protein